MIMNRSPGPSNQLPLSTTTLNKKSFKIPSDPISLFALIEANHLSPIPVLVDLLSRTPREILICLPKDDQPDVLEVRLMPDIDPIGYFFILISRLELCHGKIDSQKTIRQAQRFSELVPRNDLLLLSPHLLSFVQMLIDWATDAGQAESTLEPIANLIKLHMPLNVLTTLHPVFMRVSLLCRSIKLAVELSNHDILVIDQERSPVQYQDHLAYHYLAGTIQALNKNYRRGIHLLTIAVSAPGPGISQFQIDAYKKLVLLSLLLTSSPPTLPRYAHPQLRTTFKSTPNGKLYTDFMSLYEAAGSGGDASEKLQLMVEKHQSSFQKDNNLGLIKLCLESLPKKAVLKLIPIYSSVPLATIDRHLIGLLLSSGTTTTRELLERMIEGGELEAEIEPLTNVVKFTGRQAVNEHPIHLVLQQTISRIRSLEQMMRQTSAKIEEDPEFLKRVSHDVNYLENPQLELPSSSQIVGEKNLAGVVLEEDLAVDVSMAWDD